MTHEKTILTRQLGEKSLELEIARHPLINGRIILNYPGITGDIDGYQNKYGKLADILQRNQVGAVVRMGNEYFRGPYPETMIDNFKFVLEHCLANSVKFSGSNKPILYLMGFSAGASTIAAVASSYPQVQKILLVAPSGDAGEYVEKLKDFRGEVYIAIGDQDEVVGVEAGQFFYDLATNAKSRELVVIPKCDHQFRGETNGRIMSKAPLWAFAGDKTFPSPENGEKLY